MADLKSSGWIYLKGVLFLSGTILAAVLIILERPTVKVALLVLTAIWCSARFYYFMFYVIEHYVDEDYKFAGVGSFLRYLIAKRKEDMQQCDKD